MYFTRQLVFLTDGNPTVSEKDTDVIRRNVRAANKDGLPIFALAFGPDAELRCVGVERHGRSHRGPDA